MLLYRVGSYGPTTIEWHDLSHWLAGTAPEDVVVAVVRLVALVVAWWLLGSTVLYVLARAVRFPALIRAVEWATLPSVRRLLDGVATTTIVASSVLGGAGVASAATADPAPVVVSLGDNGTTTTTAPPYRPRPAGDDVVPTLAPQVQATITPPGSGKAHAVEERPVLLATPPPAKEATATYVVKSGDNLWTIAERQVVEMTGHSEQEITTEQVREYWVRLQKANRHRLHSGNPDLIFAGEELVLP